jgi:hypothetical protein
MAVTNFSPLLGLALPTTGDLQGTWGVTVNDSITSLLDSAVAGTTTLSADTDVTLSTTNGASNQARNAVILWTASNGATTRNITAPAQSKAYVVINAGTGSIVVRGSGPTTGVTIPSGARALVAWNGSDFVKIVSNPVVLTTDVSGVLPVANGGTAQSSYTDGQLLIGNTSGNTLTKSTLTAGTNIAITNGNGSITIAATGVGAGDVVGPGSATNSAPVAFDGTTGKLIKQASVTGTGNIVLATSPTLVTPALGTPASGNLSNTTADGTNAVGYRNIPYVADKTTSYSLVVGDVGEVIGVGTGGSITIPDATFAAGDAVLVFNNTTGDITVTCTITTAYIAGTDADVASVTLATRGVCNILFISGTVCVITGNVS